MAVSHGLCIRIKREDWTPSTCETSITWQDWVKNTSELAQTGMPSLFAILSQRPLRWLGYVCRMEDGRIPKDFLYGELALSLRPTMRFKDVCKRDMTCGIQPAELEVEVSNRTAWNAKVKEGIKSAEEKREMERGEKRTSRHKGAQPVPASHTILATDYTCSKCQHICKSRIGL